MRLCRISLAVRARLLMRSSSITPVAGAEAVIIESTYAGRVHESVEEAQGMLAAHVNAGAGGAEEKFDPAAPQAVLHGRLAPPCRWAEAESGTETA